MANHKPFPTKTFRVESENWAYFINIEINDYEKTRDMAVEAMTRALEDCLLYNRDGFVTEEENEELILGPQFRAFCEKENSDDEEDFICLTTFLLQNAGKYHTANIFKKYLDNGD